MFHSCFENSYNYLNSLSTLLSSVCGRTLVTISTDCRLPKKNFLGLFNKAFVNRRLVKFHKAQYLSTLNSPFQALPRKTICIKPNNVTTSAFTRNREEVNFYVPSVISNSTETFHLNGHNSKHEKYAI